MFITFMLCSLSVVVVMVVVAAGIVINNDDNNGGGGSKKTQVLEMISKLYCAILATLLHIAKWSTMSCVKAQIS
jgi:hypothetical protein